MKHTFQLIKSNSNNPLDQVIYHTTGIFGYLKMYYKIRSILHNTYKVLGSIKFIENTINSNDEYITNIKCNVITAANETIHILNIKIRTQFNE